MHRLIEKETTEHNIEEILTFDDTFAPYNRLHIIFASSVTVRTISDLQEWTKLNGCQNAIQSNISLVMGSDIIRCLNHQALIIMIEQIQVLSNFTSIPRLLVHHKERTIYEKSSHIFIPLIQQV